MADSTSNKVHWGGKLWLLALIAVLLTGLVLAILLPRFWAWTAEPPTDEPTPRPGLFEIPTLPPAEPTPEGESGLPVRLGPG
ncbi:MAG: hypothetical protein JXA37_02750 [Chloroflexia bacterium]|nr:hypothetical protein [Chloroflexia bacterium]